jgi:hypothetical protein
MPDVEALRVLSLLALLALIWIGFGLIVFAL